MTVTGVGRILRGSSPLPRRSTVSRTQIAWRLGYADALQGYSPRVCELCPDVAEAEAVAYANGHSSAVGVDGFGSEQVSPMVALRRAVAAETIQEVQ